MKLLKAVELKTVSKELLVKCGVPKIEAEVITDSIIYADCRGKNAHGIARLPIYIRKIKQGIMLPVTANIIIKDTPIIAIIDANNGFGQVAGYRGMKMAIEKANNNGIGLIGIRNSNNFGTAGFLAELAVSEGLIGIVIGNSAPAIAPHGGKKPILGTNPIGIAFPRGHGQPPIVIDMATSVAARGKIRMAAKNKEKIPIFWALDCNGEPTDDPFEALKGSMVPIGEHKGYGLALAIDIIAGLLTGSSFGGDVKPLNHPTAPSNFGHMVMAINISYFMLYEEFIKKIQILTTNIKKCGDCNSVKLPGETSFNICESNKEFIPLSDSQIEEINALAKELKLDCGLTSIG